MYRLKQMETSEKIASLRDSEGEMFTSRTKINVLFHESSKVFYVENPPLNEDEEIFSLWS